MFVPIGSNSGESYQTQRSLRFRASASASASRTPGAAGNRKLLAGRFRIKLGVLGTKRVIASAGTVSIDSFYLDSSDRLCLDVLGSTRLVTTPVRRDPTAWYVDVGFELDVANGTAGSRAKILIDNVEVAAYSTDGRASITNTDTNWNNTVIHYLGRDNAGNYFDGYMAEPLLTDGTKTVTYSSLSATTGQQAAVRPSATYGTQGWFLDFSDPTSTTTLMADRSGNGNNFTSSGISLTAGSTYDSMLDVPLGSGGNERGNYATLNPLALGALISAGNLDFTTNNVNSSTVCGTIAVSTGKWYWEVTCSTVVAATQVGIYDATKTNADTSYLGQNASGYAYASNGQKVNNAAATAYGATWIGSDVIGVALDMDAGTIAFYKNNAAQGTAYSGLSGSFVPAIGEGASTPAVGSINFGQRPFTYTPPSGFKALHTGNLTNTTVVTSGSFTGNLSTDESFIWCNGTPETLTINGNAVTWGTHADKLATGFKVRSSSSSYNSSGTNTWTATYLSPSSKSAFKYQNAKGNP